MPLLSFQFSTSYLSLPRLFLPHSLPSPLLRRVHRIYWLVVDTDVVDRCSGSSFSLFTFSPLANAVVFSSVHRRKPVNAHRLCRVGSGPPARPLSALLQRRVAFVSSQYTFTIVPRLRPSCSRVGKLIDKSAGALVKTIA